MKTAAQFFGEDLLPYLGIKEKIRRVAPTEHIHLEARRLEEDFNFEMKNGSYKHLEFESDSIAVRDLRRFREYEAYIGMVCDVEVSTIVICSANVKKPKTELQNGDSVYRIQVICLKERDGDRILRLLEKRKEKGKTLGRKRLFPLLLTPLMSGKVPVAERICRGLELLRSEEAGIDKETRQKMETILYALAVKLLDAKALEQVKEKMGMTLLGEMLVEDGMQKGRLEGRLEGRREGRLEGLREGMLYTLVSQVRKKLLRGYSKEQIADLLEEDIQTVENICRMISAHPEEDNREICRLLMEDGFQ